MHPVGSPVFWGIRFLALKVMDQTPNPCLPERSALKSYFNPCWRARSRRIPGKIAVQCCTKVFSRKCGLPVLIAEYLGQCGARTCRASRTRCRLRFISVAPVAEAVEVEQTL